MHAHFTESLRMVDVASAVGVHPVHLARVFRAHYGMSVSKDMRGLRVDWAARELAATDVPIAQIADRAGFSDQKPPDPLHANQARGDPAAVAAGGQELTFGRQFRVATGCRCGTA